MQKIKVLLFICFVSVTSSKMLCQTIFSNEGKYGIIDDDSKILAVPAIYNEITQCFEDDGFGANNVNHGFILRKENKYFFVLKRYRETIFYGASDYSFRQNWGQVDTIKWQLIEEAFDTLFPIREIIKDRKDGNIEIFEIFQEDTCLQNYTSTFTLAYRKGEKLGLLTYDRVSRVFDEKIIDGVEGQRVVYTLENIHIYPVKYDRIMSLSFSRDETRYVDIKFLITENERKFGIINLEDNYELEPQFDSIPLKLIANFREERHYYVKKNGLWGVIYLKENDSIPFICIPFKWENLNDLKRYIRWVDMDHRNYSTGFYLTKENEPFKLEFILKIKSIGSSTIKDKDGYFKLNENYVPASEQNVTFIPTMNGKPIVQQKNYEYLCLSYENIREDTTQFFFVFKSIRTNSNYKFNIAEYEEDKLKKAKPTSLVIYRLINNNFTLLSEFTEESDKISYQIINERRGLNCNLILKSELLENGKYKHEFFSIEGTKIYELYSKFPINYREYLNDDSYSPDWQIMKFYTEIPGKKKTKKKTVCHYNLKTQQFYK